jgi:hypothetical protein
MTGTQVSRLKTGLGRRTKKVISRGYEYDPTRPPPRTNMALHRVPAPDPVFDSGIPMPGNVAEELCEKLNSGEVEL